VFVGLAACTAYVDVNPTATVTSGDTTGGAAGTTDPTGGSSAPTSMASGETDDSTLPESCAELRDGAPGAMDGEYTVYAGGDVARPWQVWCVDMDGAPADYLTLPMAGPDRNFSEYVPGSGQGTAVRTTYSRVRIDPYGFRVDVSDQRFSSSSGQLMHGDAVVASMSYAAAMDCVDAGSTAGRGNLDLRGTPFTVPPAQFRVHGHLAAGSATPGANEQVIDLLGGGLCGYIVPEARFDTAAPICSSNTCHFSTGIPPRRSSRSCRPGCRRCRWRRCPPRRC